MVIQHNLTAMNANRRFNISKRTQDKVTEKLSSGYKINRSADDAAGLSISEKMKRQVRGLTQASANAEDGISCVQTAEGALNEVEDMLQRMNELAVKGENGTLTDTDRSYIQSEIRQLMNEVDRVQRATSFNEMNLLDGSFIKGLQVGAEAGQHIDISIANFSMSGLAAAIDNKLYTNITYNNIIKTIKQATRIYDVWSFDPSVTNPDLSLSLEELEKLIESGKYIHEQHYDNESVEYSLINNDGKYSSQIITSQKARDVLDVFMKVPHRSDKLPITYFDNNTPGNSTRIKRPEDEIPVATIQDFNSLNAFTKACIALVSQQRSDLGAVQNRLEHTINNLNNVVENTTSAEATIRDTDIATEMVLFSNNNIIQQAGAAMLSQANQSSQTALSLLG